MAVRERRKKSYPPPPKRTSQPEVRADSAWQRALVVFILLGTVATPLVINPGGQDHFRLPKQLLLIALAIVCTAVAAMGLVLRKLEWPAGLRPPAAILTA